MKDKMKRYDESFRIFLGVLTILLTLPVIAFAQTDRKLIREGNREFSKAKYSEAEISYRKASDKNKESTSAIFNTGDALFKQKKYEDAGKSFTESHKMTEDKIKKSESLYNLGNSFLLANKIQESIEAYKNSLKLDPGNHQAKYNLAYAQDQLKKQQDEKNNDDNKNKPSEFAKKLKEQADKLNSAGKFTDAYNLMNEGLKKDKTVSYYQDFITKTGKVAQIDTTIK
jgi:Ca-activated chloride channel homolog